MSTYRLPQSVHAYFTDREAKTGVDLMHAYGLDQLPASLGWDQIPAYYAAVLATAQVQVERAMALETLWRHVWRDGMAAWTALTPDEQKEVGWSLDVTPAGCWLGDSFGRAFARGENQTIAVGVEIDERDLYVYVGAWIGNETALRSADGTDRNGFELSDEHLYSRKLVVTGSADIDLTALSSDTGELLRIAEDRLSAYWK